MSTVVARQFNATLFYRDLFKGSKGIESEPVSPAGPTHICTHIDAVDVAFENAADADTYSDADIQGLNRIDKEPIE